MHFDRRIPVHGVPLLHGGAQGCAVCYFVMPVIIRCVARRSEERGRRRELQMLGVALAPEFVLIGNSGADSPDDRLDAI